MSRTVRRTPTIAAGAAYRFAGNGTKDGITRLTMAAASKVVECDESQFRSAKLLISASKGDSR
jgi:hypothetical protein